LTQLQNLCYSFGFGAAKGENAVYAIVRTGGKQYRVEQGATIYVERLPADAGSQVRLDEVLAVGAESGLVVGTPRVAGASVTGTVVEQARDRKVRVFKYKKRKHYRRTRGHRQSYTALRIDAIQA
jgi:large subunit ribosomal protein L21